MMTDHTTSTAAPQVARHPICSAFDDIIEYCEDERQWAEEARASATDLLRLERLQTRENVFSEILSVIRTLRDGLNVKTLPTEGAETTNANTYDNSAH